MKVVLTLIAAAALCSCATARTNKPTNTVTVETQDEVIKIKDEGKPKTTQQALNQALRE